MEKKTEFITDYIINYDLDIEKMIIDFKDYILSIIDRSSKGILKHEDKEEIVSDVFLSVWHNKKRIDNTRPLKYYIAGITKNLIRTKFKKLKKFENDTYLDDEEIVDLNNLDIICEEDEINEVITQELNNMKKKDYEIFCKYYYLSKSIREISNELNISEGNVKVRLHRIRKKLKVNLSKRGRVTKIIPVILVISFVTGVTFAKQILDFISVKFFNVSEGVDTAVENGYLQEVDMEYQNGNNTEITNYKNNSDVGVKVDYILMDDFYLNIVFNIDIPENSNISRIEFDNLVITDEESNLLLTVFENITDYLNFCEENGIENTKNYLALGNYNSSTLTYDSKNFNYTCSYVIRSNCFPKSKKLNISFDKIVLYTGKGMDLKILNTLYGNWDINIDIDEKMYNRKTLIYQLEYCNDENFELISASVSETGMKIECKTIWGEPIYLESDTEEEKQRKKRDFFDKPPTVENLLIQDEYVLNEKDEIFYTAQSSDSDGGYTQGLNGFLTHWQTFNLTNADATDTLTIVFTKGGEWKNTEDKKVIIKLSRIK